MFLAPQHLNLFAMHEKPYETEPTFHYRSSALQVLAWPARLLLAHGLDSSDWMHPPQILNQDQRRRKLRVHSE